MNSILLTALVGTVVSGITSSTIAPPVAPAPREAASFLSARIGTKWVYESSVGREVHKITEVKEKGDGQLLSISLEIQLPSGATKTTYQLRLSADGLYKTDQAGKRIDPPQCLLRLPFTAGQSWEWRSNEGGSLNSSFTAVGVEEVVVPAGRFKAIRVEHVIASENSWFKRTTWYAQGIGPVKHEWESTMGRIAGTITLKSFEVGKD